MGTKDVSYLVKEGSHQVAVFEGFFDFLSLLAHYRRDRANANVLVLNSLALLDRGAERIAGGDVRKVHAYLDHDEAGARALAELQATGRWQIEDASGLYLGHKDANEFLKAQAAI